MQPLNFSRQMVKQYRELVSVPGFGGDAQRLRHMIDLANASQKFMLPPGGRLLEDLEFRALDGATPLRLPYEFISLEWTEDRPGDAYGVSRDTDHLSTCPKRVLFARADEGVIRCTPNVWWQNQGFWTPLEDIGLPEVGALLETEGGARRIAPVYSSKRQMELASDYIDELSVLLSFLNALQCSNVHVERVEPSKVRKAMLKKGALPFDTYHVLTIDVPSKAGEGAAAGGHRSPREHLRRGHIRRLGDGRRIWVNAAVIGAGRGAGVVSKDYAIRGRL
jgi:hypothetical protein